MPGSASIPARAGAGVAAVIAAAVTIALPLTQASEGTKLVAYQDPARIWTICNGRTTDVKPGDRATPAQCATWLRSELAEHMAEALKATPALADNPHALAAAGDFHYNAGPVWWGKSPMARQFAARQWRAGCDAFPRYVVLYRAPKEVAGANCRRNGQGVLYCEARGLVARRLNERAMCLAGTAG